MTRMVRVGRAGARVGVGAVLAVCLGVTGNDAGAWDAVYRDDDAKRAEFEPSAIARAGDDQFWVAGLAGARSALAFYDGSAAPSRFVVVDPVQLVTVAGDGTPYTCNDVDGIQEVQRRTSAGQLVWRRILPAGAACLSLRPDGVGNVWVAFEPSPGAVTLWRLASDGTLRGEGTALQAATVQPVDYAVDADGDRIVAVGSRPQGGRFVATFAVTGPDGVDVESGVVGLGTGGSAFERVIIIPGDQAVAAGVAVDGANRSLLVARFGLDGTIVGAQVYADTPILRVLGASPAPDGGAYIVAAVADAGAGVERIQSVRIGAQNQIVTRLTLPGVVAPAAPAGLELSGFDGGAAVAFVAGDTPVTLNRLGAISSSNTITSIAFPEGTTLRTPQFRADFSRLFVDERRNPSFPGNDATLAVLNANATPGTAPPTVDVGDGGGQLLDAVSGDDGVSFLLTADASRRIGLRRVDANASASWSVLRDGNGAKSYAFAGLVDARAGVACAATVEFDGLVLDCRSAAQGTPIWFERIVGAAVTLHDLRLTGDGRLLVAYRAFTGPLGEAELHYRSYTANGARLFDSVAARSAQAGLRAFIGGGGNVLAAYDLGFVNSRRLVAFAPDGSIRYQRALPATLTYVTQVETAPDGSALVLGGRARSDGILDGVAQALDANGVEQWVVDVSGLPFPAGSVTFGSSTITLALGSTAFPAGSGPGGTRAFQLRRSDGSTVWQRDVDGAGLEPGGATFDFARNRVLLAATPLTGRVRVLAFDAMNGTPLFDDVEECEGTECSVSAVGVDATGKLRVAAGIDREERRPSSRVFTLDTVVAPPAVAAGQAGVGGAWYAPAVAGQGFVVDWIASSRTLFVPWFTFADGIDNEASALRWYTLQGTVPAGTTTATLSIFENREGAFAAGPPTGATRVGTATIRFEDCTQAVLRYTFEAGGNFGRNGAIALRRLTPSSLPCQGAAAAAGSAPSAKAVDDRFTGSWSEPALPGQGFAFAVMPGNSLFGAWFTYDPAGASDDAARQHWFTLQGSAGGSGDSVEVTIYRTLGGGFDAQPTANSSRVGTATVTFTGCDRARVEYRFDQAEIAAAYRARSGTLQLEKIGGCAAP